MPLSFAALLGGVCTLIGTSTNLVIAGLLQDQKDKYGEVEISLLELGRYGVPISMIGIAYVILVTPILLARKDRDKIMLLPDNDTAEDLLLGARIMPWSPAAERTIRRSGFRDTGGIYLVRVHRFATGSIHHAVGPEFVLSVGDILYFTGVIETFGDFCAEHGLQVVTNELQEQIQEGGVADKDPGTSTAHSTRTLHDDNSQVAPLQDSIEDAVLPPMGCPLQAIPEEGNNTIGYTLQSLMEAHPVDRMRVIHRMEDAIRGDVEASNKILSDRNRVVIVDDKNKLVVIAVDTIDRSGLLLDISKSLLEQQLELHHTEAAVRKNRSLSIWRCIINNNNSTGAGAGAGALLDQKELWSVLQALLVRHSGLQQGLRVMRARVLQGSRLVGAKAGADFRKTYKACLVAIQKGGKTALSSATFDANDILVLQVEDGSPLLQTPPEGFYDDLTLMHGGKRRAASSVPRGFISGLCGSKTSRFSPPDPDGGEQKMELDLAETGSSQDPEILKEIEAVWKDLQMLTSSTDTSKSTSATASREFLIAMKVEASSTLVGQTVAQGSIDKLPDLFLVSIERPVHVPNAGAEVSSFSAIALSEPLEAGDVLWFSGTASSVGDLRKIPGLVSYQSDHVDKMNTKVYDRRLVQAVVARKGPLVGKTVKEVRFRAQYGAAVIAVQREAERIQEHPGNIKLQAGDVLLLEAGLSFMNGKIRNDPSFILVSEVEDSAPPRLRMLMPALVLTVGAYGCYMAKLSALWGCAMVAAILMVAFGILSESEARDAIKWEIYTAIASAFGIGTALVNSGVAGSIANFLVNVGNAIGFGDAGLLGAVYLATVLISQVVANNAAAALIFPIAMDAAVSTGTDLKLMSFSIMLAASAAFMTPFGYQTNLMVMGPGGYTTGDFLVFGTPMQIVLLFATVIFLVAPWWICWLVSVAILVAASAFRIMNDLQNKKQKMS
jgi:di/tricarboxylate transporter